MNLDIFLNQRRPQWERLEILLKKSQRSLQSLSVDEVDELGQLYRTATSDLALARRDFVGHTVTTYLNQLVGRTHSFLYRGEPLRRQWLTQFFGQTFPRLYRALLPYTICSFALCALGRLFYCLANSRHYLYLYGFKRCRLGPRSGTGADVDGHRTSGALFDLGLHPNQQHPGHIYHLCWWYHRGTIEHMGTAQQWSEHRRDLWPAPISWHVWWTSRICRGPRLY